ncbi:MAG: tetratricopeptide repeat protein [Bacteroidetes bacterium]|nr:tetratricopeptide repeat protein [Bacteroidota bacterium]
MALSKSLSIVLILFLFSVAVNGNMDSLWAVWNDQSRTDSVRLEAIGQIAWKVKNTDPDSSIVLAQMQYDLAESVRNKKGIADALNTQGVSYMRKGMYDKAIDHYNGSFELREEIGDKGDMANSLNNIGFIYTSKGDLAKALSFYNRSLKLREEISDVRGIASSLSNIGTIYNDQGNYSTAIEYYSRSLQNYEKIGNNEGMAACILNIGVAYYYQDEKEQALDYFEQALKVNEKIGDKLTSALILDNIGTMYLEKGETDKAFEKYTQALSIKEEIDDRPHIATSFINLGSVYAEKKDDVKALDYYNRGLKIYEEVGVKNGIALSLRNIGQVYLDQENYSKAIDYGKRSLDLASESGIVAEIRDASKLLHRSYKSVGNSDQALKMHELFISMRDSIEDDENKRAVIRREYKYEYEKQAIADSIKAAEAAKVTQVRLEKEKTARNALIIGVALLLIVAFVLFRNYIQIRKSRELLAAKKEEVQFKNILLENSNRELNDFAQVISHDLKAPLRGIGALSNWLAKDYADKLDEQGKKNIQLMEDRVARMQNMIEDVLRYSKHGGGSGNPETIDSNQLVTEMIDLLAPLDHIKVQIIDQLPEIIADRTQITHVFQNLISNAIKYNDKPKGQIEISSNTQNGWVRFEIRDNGPGINPKYHEKIFQMFQTVNKLDDYQSTGIGLALVKKIVDKAGGRIWVESEVGEGSVFGFTWPS